MALTLVEAAKLAREQGKEVRASVIETFAMNSDVLRVLPFRDISGNAYAYNQEGALAGVAFRGVNESYTESVGVINPQTEPLTISGGDLDVDRFIVRTQGEGARASHEVLKLKGLAQQWHLKFIKGDVASNAREFDGLQVRLTGNQLVSNSAGTGAALSLANLDALIDAVDDPTHLIMSKAMRRRLTAASRLSTVGGFITYDQDEFGRQVTRYGDLPILIADGNNIASSYVPLAFDEAAAGGGTSSTSIYCVSFREGMLSGIQNGGMEVTDLGELDTAPKYRTRVEWYSGVVLEHPRAAARLYGVTNAAVVV